MRFKGLKLRHVIGLPLMVVLCGFAGNCGPEEAEVSNAVREETRINESRALTRYLLDLDESSDRLRF